MPPRAAPVPRWRRVLLLGFMAAGKSTVGPLLAETLGWSFIDADAELVRRSGVSVPGWFERGEGQFRAAEAALVAELCTRDRLVLAPGGGWAAGEGVLEGLPPGTARVWLRVSAREAVRRAAGEMVVRPLLQVPDPLATAERLLTSRSAAYARADFTIDVDGRTPADLTSEIAGWLRTSSW